jgi:cysteinyl-tRNA synthetase
MKLYNTLTRHIDTITPLAPPKVTLYTCGPTVYDYAHIGHWFNYVRMDLLVRTLKLSGYTPDWVMNITDVGHLVSDADDGEDKLQKGARREGKTAWEVATFYTRDFLECMELLNITTPDHIVKATDHIADQIALIQRLEAKGYTYIISDGVYYDTRKFEGYAAFARLDLDGLQAGARISFNSEKRNPTDFALWKFSPATSDTDTGNTRDMEWDSPWSPDDTACKGFPGWHIECSAMSMKYLGDTLDIHAGGIDHIPVHHTNEIAQSEAATGQRFANHWMHSNHVMVDGTKISKSLGNGVRLQDLITEGISADAIRLHILESHYRSQSQFSRASLIAAQNRLKNLQAMAVLRFQVVETNNNSGTLLYSEVPSRLSDMLGEDLNTPAVLAYLSDIETQASTLLVRGKELQQFENMLAAIDAALGLRLLEQPDISADQKQRIATRQQARVDKDWKTSDSLRGELADQGIGLRDAGTNGERPIWFRT